MRRWAMICFGILMVIASCGDDDGATTEAAEATTTSAAATTTAAPATTTTMPPTTTTDPSALSADRVTEIPGVSDHVSPGVLTIELDADEPGMIRVSVTGEVDVIDGTYCPFCFETIVMGPDAVVTADVLFAENEAEPNAVSVSVNISGKGPMYAEGGSSYLEAGPEGATLRKEGGGFRLIEGAARLVEASPDGQAAPATTTAAEEPAEDLPTYRDVIATYPAGTVLCTTEAGISSGDGGYLLGGFDGQSAKVQIRGGEMLYWCLGAKYHVTGPMVDEEGDPIPEGALLTLDADFQFVRVSTFDR